MTAPLWLAGAPVAWADPGEAPLVWRFNLNDPGVVGLARGATLRAEDLRDLAGRPQAEKRGLRRRLAKVLLAQLAGCHPDKVALHRGDAGQPLVAFPPGWHISLAGRWPHALIGVARQPLGVDIEPENAPPPPEDALTPAEREELADASDTTLVERWAAKEAHAKALGIASLLEGGDIHTWRDGALPRARSRGGETLCHLLRQDGLICAVATITGV